ncbi:hypothetical protein HZA96_02755 [Candidatus Woesearchaeota archaeon]|nr:hypothetical protein [Candidatus Woesearchaeota archaeon]
MQRISTLNVSFAGYDAFNEQIHKTITNPSFKDKTSLDVHVYRILTKKEEHKDIAIPFTTDFEEIVLGYFDVLIFGELYPLHDHKTVSLARQSLATGKNIIVTYPSFIEIYGNNVQKAAASHMLNVRPAYTISTVVECLSSFALYRAQKVHGADAR